MGSLKIVCWPNVEKYYGDKPALIKKYEEVIKNKKCPFCPENIKKEGFEFIVETDYWWVVKNPFPYKNSILHLLIIPKRHVISLSAFYPEEWSQMTRIIDMLFKKYSFLTKGYSLAVREGKIGGVTLYHLHLHLIVPKVDAKTGQIPVNFGIG